VKRKIRPIHSAAFASTHEGRESKFWRDKIVALVATSPSRSLPHTTHFSARSVLLRQLDSPDVDSSVARPRPSKGICTVRRARHYVVLILVIGLLTGVTGIISRNYLFYTATNVEADSVAHIYEHLNGGSRFSFFDRVQSGQLISRANSDIRSVQAYSTFAPLIVVQCLGGVLAFSSCSSSRRCSRSLPSSSLPILYVVASRCAASCSPSPGSSKPAWPDVADHRGRKRQRRAGRQSFAQEEAEVIELADTAERVAWSFTQGRPDSRRRGRRGSRTCRSWGLPWCSSSAGTMVLHGTLPVPAIVAFNLYLLMLKPRSLMPGAARHDGATWRGPAPSASSKSSTRIRHRRASPRASTSPRRRRHQIRSRAFRIRQRAEILTDFDAQIEPGEPWQSWAAPVQKSTVARLLNPLL